MRKRFIVGVDPATTEQIKAFKDYLKASPLAWWHWIPGLWLAVDSSGEMTAGTLRDQVNEMFPGLDNVVIEFRDDGTDTWAGNRSVSGDQMFRWFRNSWK